ncbi:TPA: colicin E5-related ribonuclease [Streptococcus suis]
MQNNPANYTDPSGNIRSPHAMFDDRFGGKVYNRPRPLINPDDGTLYAPSTPQHKAHQIRQQQTGNYSYVYTPKVYSNTPIIKPTSYEQAQAQRDRAREQALAEQRRQQNIRNEYSRATGSKGKAKLREVQNLIKNWGKALEETLKHVCNPQTTKGKDSGTRNKPNISVADFHKIEEANKYGLTVAQKERIDKMTLDQYLQSPQMTAEEILYARQVKFASYTEARKDVFPTFVAELSGWNNIQRLRDGVDPTTGEQANRWFAAGELSLDLASNLLPFLKAGKITQVGKILDATDDVVDTFDHVSDVAKTTDKLDDVEDVGDVAKTLTADDIIFSDKFSKSNYSSQVLDRGWNNQKIADTINNPVKTTSGYNKYTNSSVTNYYIDEIHYVAVDDSTKKVIQISDLNNPNWKGPR